LIARGADAGFESTLFSEVLVEETSDLLERLFGLGRGSVSVILGVGFALINLQYCLHARLAQLAIHTHCIAEVEDRASLW
jgi:hypothetical protein